MSRPRIPIGGYGEIAFIQRAKGKVEARTRFRDWDGQTRLVQATASSRPAAEVELKKRLAQRNAFQPVDTTLTPDSPFPALVDYWLADLDLQARIASSTRLAYERDMRRPCPRRFAATHCTRSESPAATPCSRTSARSRTPARSGPRPCCDSRSVSRSGNEVTTATRSTEWPARTSRSGHLRR